MKNLYTLIAGTIISTGIFAQQLPNGSFENWGGGPFNEPNGWFTLNGVTTNYPTHGALQDSDAYDGSSSLKLKSGHFDLTPMGFPIIDTMAYAALGAANMSGPQYGVPFTYRPDKLSFYYKYSPGTAIGNNVDTARVYVRFEANSANVGEGQFLIYGAAVNTWTYAELQITWNSQATPDTVMVDLASSMTGICLSGDPINTNLIGNELKIDKLEFIYPTNIDEQNGVLSFSLYPNPANDFVYISGVDATSRYIIFNSLGQQTLAGQVGTGGINVASLPAGIYYVQIKDGLRSGMTRLVIQ